jgi:hypothetical protein
LQLVPGEIVIVIDCDSPLFVVSVMVAVGIVEGAYVTSADGNDENDVLPKTKSVGLGPERREAARRTG